MRIEVPFRIQKGKIVDNSQKIRDHITSLDDGTYVMTVQSINPLVSERDFQKAYFAMIDICVASTGNARYIIHDAFKAESEVQTTKNFSVEQWREHLEKFRYWAYNNMDVIV